MIKCDHHETNVIRLKNYRGQIDMTNSYWFSLRPTMNIIFLLKIAKNKNYFIIFLQITYVVSVY